MRRALLPNFPLWSQRDNKYNPAGACNVTCIAMCLYYLGIRGNGDEQQLEDQLYLEMERSGLSRHSPYDLANIANKHGAKLTPPIVDTFDPNATLTHIKTHLDKRFPVVVHGYFTSFGHIVCVIGYDDATARVLLQDPWGEWSATGYDKNSKGRYWLSYRAFNDLTNHDGIWTHFFSRASTEDKKTHERRY